MSEQNCPTSKIMYISLFESIRSDKQQNVFTVNKWLFQGWWQKYFVFWHWIYCFVLSHLLLLNYFFSAMSAKLVARLSFPIFIIQLLIVASRRWAKLIYARSFNIFHLPYSSHNIVSTVEYYWASCVSTFHCFAQIN